MSEEKAAPPATDSAPAKPEAAPARWGRTDIAPALAPARARFLVISFTSDWLYPSYQSLEIVSALRSRNQDVAYCELPSNYGHDAFLVEVGEQTDLVRGFLDATFRQVSGL